eukprot:scaffold7160_cov52-Cyclotella_meneghiniana.AAC.2
MDFDEDFVGCVHGWFGNGLGGEGGGGLSEGGEAYCLHCFAVGVMGDAWFAHGSFASKSPTDANSRIHPSKFQNSRGYLKADAATDEDSEQTTTAIASGYKNQADAIVNVPSINRSSQFDAEHVFSPTTYHPDPQDIFASVADLELVDLGDTDAECLAGLFSNEAGDSTTHLYKSPNVTYKSLPQSIICKYNSSPKYSLGPRGVAPIPASESEEVGYLSLRPLKSLEYLLVFGKDGLIHKHCFLFNQRRAKL